VPSYPAEPLDVPVLNTQDVSMTLQAEDLELPASFEIANDLEGYTGSGYVSGLQGSLHNTLVFQVEIPATQHYDIAFVACSETGASYTVLVNDTEVSSAAIEGTGQFIRATSQGIYMEAGTATITIQQEDGTMLLDCMELCNDTALVPDLAVQKTPCNPDASPNTVKLMTYLGDNYGKTMLAGQHVSGSTRAQIFQVADTTGKYPAIRFADLAIYNKNGGSIENASEVVSSTDFARQDGIVGLTWSWYAPMDTGSIYSDETDFTLASAVTWEAVAEASPSEIHGMYDRGLIPEGCMRMLDDMDVIAMVLQDLCEEDVPVMFQPLYQAGNDAYWWNASGSDAYIWLWNLLYTRMTSYYHLNNLIWIWDCVDGAYAPYSSQYDMASTAIYLEDAEEIGSGYEAYYMLQEAAPGKMLALSVCSRLPDVDAAFRDGCVWSYFGLWYETLAEIETDSTLAEEMIHVYNSEGVASRDDVAQLGIAPKSTS
jgi:mannan endo-1,4-beta-mannosidase